MVSLRQSEIVGLHYNAFPHNWRGEAVERARIGPAANNRLWAARRKRVKEGRPGKQKRWLGQVQSLDPKRGMGVRAFGRLPSISAHSCSLGTGSGVNQMARKEAAVFR